MSVPYVCQACCRRLGRIRPSSSLQRHAQATFVSLSESQKRKAAQGSRDSLLDLGDVGRSNKGRYANFPLERKGRTARRSTSKDPGDHLESLFAESIKPLASSSNTPSQTPASITPYQNAEILRKKLADNSCPAIDSWNFFLDHFGPAAWKRDIINRGSSPSYLYIRDGSYSGRTLLNRIIQAKDEDPSSTTLPSFTEVSFVYSQLGILHGPDWAAMMFSSISRLLDFQKAPIRDHIQEDVLISDIIGSWNVVLRQVGKSQHPVTVEGTSLFDWSHVPSISFRDLTQLYKKRGVQGCFGSLVPSFPFHQLKDIPIIAVASFALLTQEQHSNKAVVQEAEQLVSLLGRAISRVPVDSRPTSQTPGLAAVPVDEFVNTTWIETRELATRLHSRPAEGTPASAPGTPTPTRYTFQQKRLQDALNRRDIRQVDLIWNNVVKFPVRDPTADDGPVSKGFLSIGLCNQFILIYMSLRRPNRAIEVWNVMVDKGLSPNMLTWDCMLTGCKKSRDALALEGVWTKMMAIPVLPDAVCWTTRISGLVECNQFDQAIHALDEMGQLWLAAAQREHGKKPIEELRGVSDVPGATKPTISVVNAAIDGLLKKQRRDDAYRVLAWAGKFGIRPDIITYNTLLRSLIRNGQTEEAMALLQQMHDDGLKADVATFTTVLDETFRYPEHTPEEQSDIISGVFAEMKAAGIEANLHTYGKIIYYLLESNNGDLTPVNGVLERMSREGIQPSLYISTMLVEHYFSRQPPDLDAVRLLIDRTRLEPGSVDHIFWDRVIEGYSRVGDTTSAMRILGKVHTGSGRVSWTTLQILLGSLAHNQEWDAARTLVRNTRIDTGGPLPENVRGKKDQHRFWDLASELELLDS